jgi:hypothetical protein
MIALLCFVLAALAAPFKSKSRLEAENAALRHQLIGLRMTNDDRWFLIQLHRWFRRFRHDRSGASWQVMYAILRALGIFVLSDCPKRFNRHVGAWSKSGLF